MFKSNIIALAVTLTTLSIAIAPAVKSHAEERPEVEIKSQKLTDGIYVLFGRGGNIGLSVGEDGAYIIDDQFAPLSEKINSAIDKITKAPVKFVVNTHWHFDHTGGNENFGKEGAVIVAHENVHKRMSTRQEMKAFNRVVEAAPKVAQPSVTYQKEMSLKLNNDKMRIVHVANAHTDGDSLIYFEQDNVLHMGDCYFKIGYPFIDLGSGGSIDGYINALETGLALSNDKTKIIPGHGPMANKSELAAYTQMLKDIRQNVAELKADGKSLEATIAAKPSAKYDAKNGVAFIKPEQIVTAIYNSL
ncbi:MBL fold metallo-hydrolase [Kangiella sp. HZ709]|uniref:MBL fold metallo-hydrolase n=1 Tax=Kangiella sp. HZ709 TaxID=2666328 RepID=UPI0012AF068A|nr:MBL fold metallo-hydrolase [Kangiella sp. HZ709]MRX27517.1 MBL fold metallo-hydrolase [Kangiella sp. HZ709]